MPFGVVVIAALLLTAPAVLKLMDGSMDFDAAAVRFLAALAVAWALINLVVMVARAMSPAEGSPMEDQDASSRA